MKTVLGLSMTSTSIDWVLLDGADPDGTPLDDDAFAVEAGELTARGMAAVRGAQAIAAASGYQLASIGVTWSTEVESKAGQLIESLKESGFDDVRAIGERSDAAPAAEAADEWDEPMESAHKAAQEVATNIIATPSVARDAVDGETVDGRATGPSRVRTWTIVGSAAVAVVVALLAVGSQFIDGDVDGKVEPAPSSAPVPQAIPPVPPSAPVAVPSTVPPAAVPSTVHPVVVPTAEVAVPAARPITPAAPEAPPRSTPPQEVHSAPPPEVATGHSDAPVDTPPAPVAVIPPAAPPAPEAVVPQDVTPPQPQQQVPAPPSGVVPDPAATATGPLPGPPPAVPPPVQPAPPPPPQDPLANIVNSIFGGQP